MKRTARWLVATVALCLPACGGSNAVTDAGTAPDAGKVDAGAPDGGGGDAGGQDSGAPDAGTLDAGHPCVVGMQLDCYDGPTGTEGVGACVHGERTCQSDAGFSACTGEVLPTDELCGNGLDEDCSGAPDDPPDLDGDGFNRCQGDCCESTGDGGCPTPALVNPAAFDILANGVDDDCNGLVDDAPTCDQGLASDSAVSLDAAKALEVCASTSSTSKLPGLITSSYSLVDGTGTPAADQHSIRSAFGAVLVPRSGSALLVLSTGVAAATGQMNPSFASYQPGTDHGATSAFPADWLSANASVIPVPAACPPVVATAAHDPVMLNLELHVPINAHAVAFDFDFLTADFPEYVCSGYVDVFVALLDSSFSGAPANPPDENIAALQGNVAQAVTADMAWGNTGYFSECVNGAVGCLGTPSTLSTCLGTQDLAGTGFDEADAVCAAGDTVGGGTGWHTAQGNVVPGEQITLRLALWDTSDGKSDSTVVLDHLRWLPSPVTPGLQ